MNEYSIPKPTYPIYLRLLAGLVTIGLFGLGLVSYHTFNQVHGPFVAAIYAAIIEVGAALDAIGLAGGINRRSWWLIPAVLLTVIGSGWYNLAAVAQSGATWGIENAAELTIIRYAIAWLPLASLSFMALGLGFKIADHEAAVQAWAIERQAWQDARAEKEAKRQERKEARAAKVEASRQRVEAAAALPGSSTPEGRNFLEASRQRIEAAECLPGTSTPEGRNFLETSRGSYADFQELLRANHHEYKNADLAKRFNVSTRTVTTWRARYDQEHPQPQPIAEVN